MDPTWITPEMQAALDAANARLASLAPVKPDYNPARFTTARELVREYRIKLKPSALKMLADDLTPRQFYERTRDTGELAAARRILAHALPVRRALWWGMLAARDAFGESLPDDLAMTLAAVGCYVQQPTEDHRRATGEVARRLRASSLAACLAYGAFCSAGSIAPPGMPPVWPKPFITGRLVGVAVYLAAVRRDAKRYKDVLRRYLQWGEMIASGDIAIRGDVMPIRLQAGEGQMRFDPAWLTPGGRPSPIAGVSNGVWSGANG